MRKINTKLFKTQNEVKKNPLRSDVVVKTICVLQGLILGPPLFLSYVNEAVEKAYLYADNTIVIVYDRNRSTLQQKITGVLTTFLHIYNETN